MSETAKAHNRRLREGYFQKYCQGKGIEVGCGRVDSVFGEDLVAPGVLPWDQDNGDASFMDGVADESFDFVHASHVLEHLWNPSIGVLNWFRILKPGGFLLINVPHRDLYEKKLVLPSSWNFDHKNFFLPDKNELPCTLSLKQVVETALHGKKYEILELKVCDEGHTITERFVHSDGEYSIEMVVKKL